MPYYKGRGYLRCYAWGQKYASGRACPSLNGRVHGARLGQTTLPQGVPIANLEGFGGIRCWAYEENFR